MPAEKFATVTWAGDDGKARPYDLGDTGIRLTFAQVTRRKPATGGGMRQAHILTTRAATCPPPPSPGG